MMEEKRKIFGEQILEHQTSLFQFARYLTGNEPDAADLLQDTFVKALRKWDRFQPGTNLRAWLGRIMHNAFLDSRRRLKTRPTPADLNESGDMLESVQPDREPVDRIAEALQYLEPMHRALIVLCDLQGHSYKEIAEIMDRPLGTIMSGIHRARQKLQAVMNGRATAAA